MKPQNLLILMSDEHNPKIMGCAGNDIIQTPHLDALARRGTRFTSAYTTCPLPPPQNWLKGDVAAGEKYSGRKS